MDTPHVAIAMPRHKSEVHFETAQAVYATASKGKCRLSHIPVGSSLLARGFNWAWSSALTMAADAGVTHFAMVHSDVVPEPYWLDTLMNRMQQHDADLVSVVVPLKDTSGVTSTAIGHPGTRWKPLRRLTMTEVMGLPETFTAADAGYPDHPLLVNTGCWLVDLRRPFWTEMDDEGTARFHFTINDRICRGADGNWTVECESEDWFFSRLLHDAGARVFATRSVAVEHCGEMRYHNRTAWGKKKTAPCIEETMT